MINKRQGFTLIEILIVVAIIAILASMVLVGLGPLQRRGRDARRLSDLRQVQNGLELYFAKNSAYPISPNPISQWSDLVAALKNAGIGVSNVPSDPSSPSKVYTYGSTNGTSYVLRAELEDSTNPALKDNPGGTIEGLNCGETSSTYCLQL